MADIPPEYDQYHKELQRAIDNPVALSSATLTSAANTVNSAASAGGSESGLLDEIKSMSGAATSVDNSFGDVAKLFLNVRNGLSSPAVKADMAKLETRWNTHHQTYKSLLWQSRAVAGKAQAAADDFTRDFVGFLGDDNESMKDKKNEIRSYLEVLEKDGKASETMAQGFADLRTGIISLVEDWKGLVVKYKIDALSARVENLKQEIDQLSRALVDLDLKIAALTAKLNVSYGFNGAVGVLGIIAPWWCFGILIQAILNLPLRVDIAKAQKERGDVDARYRNKLLEYQRTLPELIQVQELQGTLKQSNSNIDNIISKIAGFAKVWAMIRTDLQAIAEKLDYVVGTESERLFKSRLNSTAKLYAMLGKALYQYQIVITADHPAFVNMNARV
ncbi:hypothetical protein EIP91_002232 [Steccherinum ochraceum]|uniref:Uncharacterized protein n=1 Tax=Steccherinum ochraceum TaxID=92696 RepID=A0A4R0RPM1_9APHY|nr:hypothetical protein EIP91_002232 [Steccherinum ochraceum]